MKFPKHVVCLVALLGATSVMAGQDLKWVNLEKTDGAALFGEKCGMCHRGNGMGTALLGRRLPAEQAQLESRTDLQAAFIETVVRSGFGVMYPISRGEVSDKQLTLIKQHLVKQQGGKP